MVLSLLSKAVCSRGTDQAVFLFSVRQEKHTMLCLFPRCRLRQPSARCPQLCLS